MEWPFRRFLKAFDAFQRRKLVEEWTQRKALHVAALVANTNMDEEKNDRAGATTKIERAYDATMAMIWNGPDAEVVQEDQQSWESDFMRAGRNQLAATGFTMPGETQIGELP